jgi:cytochrome c oxidase subunit 4
MSNPTSPVTSNPPAAHAGTHKATNYMLIWLYLAVLTVVEVLVAFVSHMPFVVLVIALLFLALWKALLVALYYMHLRFEPRKLWIVASIPIPLILIFLGVVLMERF